MINYSVDGNILSFSYQMEVPLDSEDAEKVISDIDKKPLYRGTADWQEFKTIYLAERQKYLDRQKAGTPKVELDISDLDVAIAKVDELIAKLKTAQLLIGYLGKKD